MTRSQTPLEEVKRGRGGILRAYLTSLLYLREEARRDGLEALAGILCNAIAAIETWLDTGDTPESHHVLDSDLCHSLDFLLKWLALPAASQHQVVRTLASFEGGEDHTAPRLASSVRLSKETAT